MGDVAFEERNARRVADFEAAVQRVEAKSRGSKHDKNKESSKHEHSRDTTDDDDSEDDVPLALQRQRIKQQIASHRSTVTNSHLRDCSPLGSLLHENQDAEQSHMEPNRKGTDGDLFVRQTPIPRKPPFHDSGSSSSEAEAFFEETASMSDDSVMGKTHRKAKQPKRKSVDLTAFRNKSTDVDQSSKNPANSSSLTPKTIQLPKKSKSKVKPLSESSKPLRSSNKSATREAGCGLSAQSSAAFLGRAPQLSASTIQGSLPTQPKTNR